MPTDPTADIIPFPVAAVPDRLTRALTRLEDALALQQEAVANWRLRLELLRGSVSRLENSLHCYENDLDSLQDALVLLRRESERLAG